LLSEDRSDIAPSPSALVGVIRRLARRRVEVSAEDPVDLLVDVTPADQAASDVGAVRREQLDLAVLVG
jgi:hypothetical protein